MNKTGDHHVWETEYRLKASYLLRGRTYTWSWSHSGVMSCKEKPKPKNAVPKARRMVKPARGAAKDRMIEVATAAKNTMLLFMRYVHPRKIRISVAQKYVHAW